MANAYLNYYTTQVGSGVPVFAGVKYQTGSGFGRFLKSLLMPVLGYLGKQALNTGINIGGDILAGDNVKQSAAKRMKTTGRDILGDAMARAKVFAQTGKGRKRKSPKSGKPLIKAGKGKKASNTCPCSSGKVASSKQPKKKKKKNCAKIDILA